MSWNISFKNIRTEADFADDSKLNYGQRPVLTPEMQDQYDVAKYVAGAIIATGAVGDATDMLFSVSLSGDGNPMHKPAQGYANDCIGVSVSQQSGSAE